MPVIKEQPKKHTPALSKSTEPYEVQMKTSRLHRSLGWVFDQHHPVRQILVVAGLVVGIVAGLLQVFVTFFPEPDLANTEKERSTEERSSEESKDDQKEDRFDLVPMPSFDLSTFPKFRGVSELKITTSFSSLSMQRASQGVAPAMLFKGDQERYLLMRTLHDQNCNTSKPLTPEKMVKCESNLRRIHAVSQSYTTMVFLICGARHFISLLSSSNSLAELRENRSLADELAEKYSKEIAGSHLQFYTTRNSYGNAEMIGGMTSEDLFENFFSQTDPIWKEAQSALRYGKSNPPKVSKDAHARINQIRLMRSSITAELSELCRANNQSL